MPDQKKASKLMQIAALTNLLNETASRMDAFELALSRAVKNLKP